MIVTPKTVILYLRTISSIHNYYHNDYYLLIKLSYNVFVKSFMTIAISHLFTILISFNLDFTHL